MPPLKPAGREGTKARTGPAHPEDGYVRQVERVARGVGVSSAGQGVGRLLVFAPLALAVYCCSLVSLGLYSSDRQLLASFGGALRGALGRKPVT